jgi:hypothetical protein
VIWTQVPLERQHVPYTHIYSSKRTHILQYADTYIVVYSSDMDAYHPRTTACVLNTHVEYYEDTYLVV